jgi:hypothetical protein
MQKLYEAANALEAHMILDLLKQEGLAGRIDGEHLQGAAGELPLGSLVRVMVEEQDLPAARAVIARWEAAQPKPEPPKKPHTRFGSFALGLGVGVLCTWALFRSPVTTDGVDYNHDGVLDEKWIYAPSGTLLRNEFDRNLDGKVDQITRADRRGLLESAESDDDFDGVFESRARFANGNFETWETDTDRDTVVDLVTRYRHGVPASMEYIDPYTGRPEKIVYFKLGKLTHAERDTDKDGKLDQRTRYDAIGEVAAVEAIR